MLFKRIITRIILLVAMTGQGFIYAEDKIDPNAEMIKQSANQFMERNAVPGIAILLYINGQPSTYYFGYANKEKQIPVTKNTIFEVGSITKLMTSLLLAQQVDAAKSQLDDSITNYLTDLPATFEDMTLGNLATHTAGLPLDWPSSVQTSAELKQYYLQWHPEYPADDQWIYSNVGMGLLGEALQQMTHTSLEQLYAKKILAPLGMSNFALTIPANAKKFLAQGYNDEGMPVQPEPVGLFPAAYGIKISAQDMQRFLAAVIGIPGTPTRILYPIRMTQAAYVQLADRKQGLGWQIHSLKDKDIHDLLKVNEPELGPSLVEELYEFPRYDAEALMDKTGTTNGFKSYIAVLPKKQAGIVIMVNRHIDHSAMIILAREILFKVSGLLTTDDAVNQNNV